MPYTLRSTALTAKLVHCIAVDDDDAVKDFVSGSSVTMSWVDGSNGAISGVFGAEQWRAATSNASSHRYFHTSAARFVKFGVKPTFALGATNSIFLAFSDAVRNEANNSSFLSNSADNWVGAGGYAYWTAVGGASSCSVTTTHSTDASTAYVGNSLAGQRSLAFVSDDATSVTAHLDGTDRTNTSTDFPNSTEQPFQPGFIGGRGDGTVAAVNYLGAKMFCVAQFNDVLTAQEITDLNTDWFGTLFTGTSLVKKLKIRVHPSAASATGIEGVVFEDTSGIVAAELGEFTGAAFEATTEGSGDNERAVLKVLASACGCSGLAVNDTVHAIVRKTDGSLTTGILRGDDANTLNRPIIIEE